MIEQLQNDGNYTRYLVSMIETKARECSNYNELEAYIQNLMNDVRKVDCQTYIRNNNLIFDFNELNDRTELIKNSYLSTHQQVIGSNNDNNQIQDNVRVIQPVDTVMLASNQVNNYGGIFNVNQEQNDVSATVVDNGSSNGINNDDKYFSAFSDEELNGMLGENISDDNRSRINNELNNREQNNLDMNNGKGNSNSKALVKSNPILPRLSSVKLQPGGYISTLLLIIGSAIFGIVIAVILVTFK